MKGKIMQLILTGCPGVGKGTYASRLAKHVNVPHIAMGDLVREELKSSSRSTVSQQLSEAMNKGKLLPDGLIFNLLSRRLEQGKATGERGFILDGFPRTISQAEGLRDVTDVDLVVNLNLPEDVLVKRCLGRRVCSRCGGNFNIANIDAQGSNGELRLPAHTLLPPPGCASRMTIRADDKDEVIRARLRVYREESAPVEGFYRKQSKLLDFDVSGGISETWSRLLAALNLQDDGFSFGVSEELVAESCTN